MKNSSRLQHYELGHFSTSWLISPDIYHHLYRGGGNDDNDNDDDDVLFAYCSSKLFLYNYNYYYNYYYYNYNNYNYTYTVLEHKRRSKCTKTADT